MESADKQAEVRRAGRAAADSPATEPAMKSRAPQASLGPRMAAQRTSIAALQSGPRAAAAPRRNARSGLPEQLRSGIESLSGLPMDGVRVHYNSPRPAQLNAQAYAQGHDIHLAPGQERHLPHEAWHVAQQAQGRVRPTRRAAGGVAINDERGLEREADAMGAKALNHAGTAVQRQRAPARPEHGGGSGTAQLQKTAVAILGQTHTDLAFLEHVQLAIERLQGAGIPFTVVIEETPDTTLDELIKRCEDTIEAGKSREGVSMAEAELPIYRFIRQHSIRFMGVDSPKTKQVDSATTGNEAVELVDRLEFERLQAMTQGILGEAAALTRQGGGVVLGIQFGNSHIAGLMEMLRQGADKQGMGTTVSGTISTGGYTKRGDALKSARRSADSQQSSLKKHRRTDSLDELILTLGGIVEECYEEDTWSTRGITVTCTSTYRNDVAAVVDRAIDSARKKGIERAQIRIAIDDDLPSPARARSRRQETAPLLGADDDGCCCCIIS